MFIWTLFGVYYGYYLVFIMVIIWGLLWLLFSVYHGYCLVFIMDIIWSLLWLLFGIYNHKIFADLCKVINLCLICHNK